MTFTPERNPQIIALAKEAAQKINELGEAHQKQIEAIYRDFRTQADAIRRGEASAATLDGIGASASQTTVNES